MKNKFNPKNFEHIKDKDELISILMKQCKELWDENESLKFQLFDIEHSEMILKEVSLKLDKSIKLDSKINFSEVISLISKLEDPLVDVGLVHARLEEIGINEKKRNLILKKLKEKGEIFEPRKGRVKTL